MSADKSAADAVTQTPIAIHSDVRGSVFEPFDASVLEGMQNCHVVHNNPGCVRGNHRHRVAHECLVVTGPALVRFGVPEDYQEVTLHAGDVTRFFFPPGVAHAVLNPVESVQLLVAASSEQHDPEHPDTEYVGLF